MTTQPIFNRFILKPFYDNKNFQPHNHKHFYLCTRFIYFYLYRTRHIHFEIDKHCHRRLRRAETSSTFSSKISFDFPLKVQLPVEFFLLPHAAGHSICDSLWCAWTACKNFICKCMRTCISWTLLHTLHGFERNARDSHFYVIFYVLNQSWRFRKFFLIGFCILCMLRNFYIKFFLWKMLKNCAFCSTSTSSLCVLLKN